MKQEKLDWPDRNETELKFLQGMSRHGRALDDLIERIPAEALGVETYQDIYSWLKDWVGLCQINKEAPSFARYVRDRFPGQSDEPTVLLACSLHQTPWEPYQVRLAADAIEEWHAKDRAVTIMRRFQERVASQPLEQALADSQAELEKIQLSGDYEGRSLAEAWGPGGEYWNLLQDNVAYFRKHGKPRRPGLMKTGFAYWDEHLGGLQRKRMVVIGGRPAGGKTTISNWLGLQVGKQHKVLMVTLEMSQYEATLKAVSALTNIETQLLDDGRLTDSQVREVEAAMATIQASNFTVLEPLSMDITTIRRACFDHIRRHGGLDVLIVDYLQIVRCAAADRQQPRYVQVGNISTALKRLARELNICVVIPAQLGRESVKRSMPELVDLRESGSIEQDADQVVLLDRVKDRVIGTTEERDQYENQLALLMKKNRMGPTATMIINVNWKSGHMGDSTPEMQNLCGALYGYCARKDDADFVLQEQMNEKRRREYVPGYRSNKSGNGG